MSSKVIDKVQCPECLDTGRDNLAIYEDGGSYCFSCGFFEKSEEIEDRREHVESNKEGAPLIFGHSQDIPNRGLSKKVCEFFGYEIGKKGDKKVHIANYKNSKGEVVAQKIRAAKKQMAITGDASSMELYGQHLWEPSPKVFVTVVEGEIDALSVAEMQGTSYPVVSIPMGANGAAKALKKSLEWLSGFKHVVLAFDMDDAGKAAVSDCVDIFEIGKVRIAKFSEKDANEMLVKGKSKEFREALFNAQTVKNDSILGVGDLIEKALTRPEMGLEWPWPSLDAYTYGIRDKSIYTLGAGSGIGKTEFIKDTIFKLCFDHKQKVGIMSFEQDPAQALLRFAGAKINKRLHIPGTTWNEDEIRKAILQFEDKLYFHNNKESLSLDNVVAKIRYFVKALGCKFIVLDPFTAVAADMDDERRGIDKAMKTFGGLVHELDCTLFLVSHLAKPNGDGKSYEEGKRVAPAAFRGSQSIQYWSNFMLGLERNKLADDEEERTITTVRILKDRFSGEADGKTIKLKYNRGTGLLDEYVDMDDTDDSDDDLEGII